MEPQDRLIRSLVNRAKRLCTPSKLSNEVKCIKKFAAYNGFPKWIAKNIIRQSLDAPHNHPRETTDEDEHIEKLYMFLPYNGKQAEAIVKRCKKRLVKLFKRNKIVKFEVCFQSTKISFFTSNKDRIPFLSNSGLIYEYRCLGCSHTPVSR